MLCLTFAAWWHTSAKETQLLKTEFDTQTTHVAAQIKNRLDEYSQALHVAQAFHASGNAHFGELSKFIGSMRFKQMYPGISHLSVAMIVSEADKARHVARMRAEGLTDYAIFPEGKRPLYIPVVFHKSFIERGVYLYGRDVAANPDLRSAMERSRDTGNSALTPKTRLFWQAEQDNNAGALMFVPIYRKGLPHDTLGERRKNIAGWFIVPFLMGDFMTGLGLGDEINGVLGIEIYDGENVAPSTQMYRSASRVSEDSIGKPEFEGLRRIEFAGRIWTLRVRSTPAFEAAAASGKSGVLGTCGFILSVLLTMLTWVLANSRERAVDLANRMTRRIKESETRFRLMADAAPAMIWMSNADRTELWANKGWHEFIGIRSGVDDFNQNFKERFHPDDWHAYEVTRNEAAKTHRSFTSEFRVRRHDGQYRWILSTAIPRFDESGYFIGFIGSGLDITQRKEDESTIRQLSANLLSAKEEEARRIAHEIHDELGQQLTWQKINIMLLPKLIEQAKERLPATLERLSGSVDNCLGIVRNIASGLRPAVLDVGIVPAIEWLVEEFESHTGIDCTLHNSLDPCIELQDTCAISLFRILQEALTNVARHANASHVDVSIGMIEEGIYLEIRDDGIGMTRDISQQRTTLGLTGMRERVAILGGEIRIDSVLEQGTWIHVTIPINKFVVSPEDCSSATTS